MRQIYKGSFPTKRSAKENLCEAKKDSIYLSHSLRSNKTSFSFTIAVGKGPNNTHLARICNILYFGPRGLGLDT